MSEEKKLENEELNEETLSDVSGGAQSDVARCCFICIKCGKEIKKIFSKKYTNKMIACNGCCTRYDLIKPKRGDWTLKVHMSDEVVRQFQFKEV